MTGLTNNDGAGAQKHLTNRRCPHHSSALTGLPMHEFKAGKSTAGLVWIWHSSCWSVLCLRSSVSTIRCFGNRAVTSVTASRGERGPIWCDGFWLWPPFNQIWIARYYKQGNARKSRQAWKLLHPELWIFSSRVPTSVPSSSLITNITRTSMHPGSSHCLQ